MDVSPRIKICGLTQPEDAALAAEQGAWALGVILAEESSRFVDAEEAAGVLAAAPAGVERVGVFVNASLADIETANGICGFTAVQLHGEETPDFCSEVAGRTGLKVIKALRVADAGTIERVALFDTSFILLDTYLPGVRGGTGESFDLSLANALPEEERRRRIILSGGLTPRSAPEAWRQVRPFALDISSGVELEPGIKDPQKIIELFANMKENQI